MNNNKPIKPPPGTEFLEELIEGYRKLVLYEVLTKDYQNFHPDFETFLHLTVEGITKDYLPKEQARFQELGELRYIIYILPIYFDSINAVKQSDIDESVPFEYVVEKVKYENRNNWNDAEKLRELTVMGHIVYRELVDKGKNLAKLIESNDPS
jgi:hypothetical protein